MIAPIPGRPPARPFWETTVANRTRFSPAGPIETMPASLDAFFLSCSSVSKELLPHRLFASWNSHVLSFMWIVTGVDALPSMMSAS